MGEESLGFVHRYEPPADPHLATTLLLLHGTGGTEDDLVPLAQVLAPGSGLLSPRGRVLERGMPRFFRRLAEGVFDLPDLIARTNELADFVRAAAIVYGFDATRVIAVGFSNGANIAASTLLLRPGVLRGAVLFRAMVPIEPETPPELAGTPVLLSAGRVDSMIPPSDTERLAALLGGAGAAVTLAWQLAGHTLEQGDIDAARDWLAPLLVK